MVIKNKQNIKAALILALTFGVSFAYVVLSSKGDLFALLILSFLYISLLVCSARLVFELELLSARNPTLRFQDKFKSVFAIDPQVDAQNFDSQVLKLFVPKIVEGAVNSRAQLGQALADLMKLTFSQLTIKGMEVALFDSSTNYFYFSLMMGFVSGETNHKTLELPLSFSGKILGSVKFESFGDDPFSNRNLSIAKLLTLQVGVLFVNAEYSAELLRMQRSADESLRAKTGFLANLSHEVRAPLGVIINATELVVDGLCGEITDDQRRILGLAKKGSEHLLELINDVLDYAKIEAGKLAPVKKDIEVHEILRDITNIVRFQSDQKQIQLNHIEGLEELAVSADRKHLRQILINLLTNAVKYTPENGSVEVWAERTAGKLIRINVKDSGVGIDPSQSDKVFAPFERVNHSYSMKQAGVGLGLSLAKRLAELNGGSLGYESKLGSGSRFWVNLKSTEIDPLDKAQTIETKNTFKSKNETIVLIDPDPDHLSILSRYLADLGYNIKSFANYAPASECLNQKEAQLLILDNTELDDISSTVGNEITNLVESQGISVLLLSSRAFMFDIEKYLKLGVERCLSKPVPLKELAILCRQVLEGRSDGVPKSRENSEIESSTKSGHNQD